MSAHVTTSAAGATGAAPPAHGPRSGPGRRRLVWRVLADALVEVTRPDAQPLVLDCGGGSGSFAVPLAEAGARVTLVDVSVDALATLHRRAAEAGVADRVHPVQGDVEALREVVPAATFDLALAHELLGDVDNPAAALAEIAAAVRAGGLVSILLANPAAGVLSRALAGDVTSALDELRALAEPAPIGGLSAASGSPSAGPGSATVGGATVAGRLDSSAVTTLCARVGLVVEQVHGVGVFTELVPGAELEGRPGGLAALDELEELAAGREPFRDIASRLHVLARRADTPHGRHGGS